MSWWSTKAIWTGVAMHMILRMEERLARFSFIAARAGFKGRGNERRAAGRDDLDVPV